MMTAYTASTYKRTGCIVETSNLNRARLNEMKNHKNAVENHHDPELLPEISKSFSVMKFLDQLPTYLLDVMGVSGVALSYVIRENATPPAVLPALLDNKPWSDGHSSVMEELVAFTKHEGPSFKADNAYIFRILSNALSGTSAMTSITRHQRNRDGRSAYHDFVTHNMGLA